jgi:hypothetical protein
MFRSVPTRLTHLISKRSVRVSTEDPSNINNNAQYGRSLRIIPTVQQVAVNRTNDKSRLWTSSKDSGWDSTGLVLDTLRYIYRRDCLLYRGHGVHRVLSMLSAGAGLGPGA